MEIEGSRVLVAGATGVLGGHISRALSADGARLVLAGRDEDALEALASETGAATLVFDALDSESCAAVVARAAGELGGLDALIVAFGVVAFGPEADTEDWVTEHVFQVNALAPMTMLRAALKELEPGGSVAVITAVTADYPTAGMATYSASKSALSAWLQASRAEYRRKKVSVLDIRAPHMDTGLAHRAVAGAPPARLPEPFSVDALVEALMSALRSGARRLAFDPQERELRVR
ncbi:SDR family NAD(P)-dependent oxidoreductase [Nocardiopsis metallicus]|uniref:Short-subunit dehydrogenase n=1 Tax=Nocardiopsis metallicus TaxID=179819 RepID=A0A840W0P2_9ACTN|nr:SDR family oxidoreductase [Nocardiopsis metallicus]MBB5489632.1 short-subunit dehydrogenase [Nocardiopsis metallicus]